jgi:hypothetical protein
MINVIRILHIVTVSFICREGIIKYKQMRKQKGMEQENGMSTELETTPRAIDKMKSTQAG